MSQTYIGQIAANTDDGCDLGGSTWVANQAIMGYTSAALTAGFRFLASGSTGTLPPSGATIETAVLSLCAKSSIGSFPGVRVYGVDADDPATWGDGNKPASAAKTTEYVDYQPVAWVASTWYDLPDISAVVQEIIDRAGYAEGNDLALVISNQSGGTGQYFEAWDYYNVPAYSAKLILTYSTNTAPNAPLLYSPVGGVSIPADTEVWMLWTFSDDDAGDTQSACQGRYREQGTSTWTTSAIFNRPYNYITYVAGTFSAGNTYEWQARTADAQGEWGPWSASETFVVAEPPDAPTLTAPLNGTTISTASYAATWSKSEQDAYQIRRLADDEGEPDTDTVYYDSGTVSEASTRAHVLTFATNLRYEHIQLRSYYDSMWSSWASARAYVSYDPPATPTVVVIPDNTHGRIAVTATHPTPEGSQPTVVAQAIYRSEAGAAAIRIASDIAPSATYHDYAIKSGVVYGYIVRAIGSTGTMADSELTL